MMLIAHRGNTVGPSASENKPEYLAEAIERGFTVEVDVWTTRGGLWFGHDRAEHLVPDGWIERYASSSIFHCKNLEALVSMRLIGCHYFWHQEDEYTLTSKGVVWVYPHRPFLPTRNFICCQPDARTLPEDWRGLGGICSDYVDNLRQQKEESDGRQGSTS